MAETFRTFQRETTLSTHDICADIFRHHADRIQVRKESTAIRNLCRIVDATLDLANAKGFQAMSLRDLSRETGLSMGALYAYIGSKEDLVALIQGHGRRMTERVLSVRLAGCDSPRGRLHIAVRSHLYLSELLHRWFYFGFMEAKNLPRAEKRRAAEAEQASEDLFAELIRNGQTCGQFRTCDAQMHAGWLKATLQDWYLKRSKYRRQGITVEAYAAFVIDLAEHQLRVERETQCGKPLG